MTAISSLFYTVFLRLYYLSVLVTSVFKVKARHWISGRKKWKKYLALQINPEYSYVWFHCSSLGEHEDCREVFTKIRLQFPSWKTILTVFSPSAYETLKNSGLYDVVAFLPLDTKRNAASFMEIVRPELILFARSELWLNFLLEAKRRQTPLFLISLRLNSRSNFLKWPVRKFYRQHFHAFTHIFCQTPETATHLLNTFNFHRVSVTGNTRFESVHHQSGTKVDFDHIARFTQGSRIVMIGSSMPREERFFLRVYDNTRDLEIKWIVVPHDIHESILTKKRWPNIIRLSNIDQMTSRHDILLVDSVGILKFIYKYADFAIIGGGFNRMGIHNILEPAVFGLRTAFGPNHRNYAEALDFLNAGFASVFRNAGELETIVRNVILPRESSSVKREIMNYMKHHFSDSHRIANEIAGIISVQEKRHPYS